MVPKVGLVFLNFGSSGSDISGSGFGYQVLCPPIVPGTPQLSSGAAATSAGDTVAGLRGVSGGGGSVRPLPVLRRTFF